MIVFISGQYLPDGSHLPQFAEAAAKIEAGGHQAINPAVRLPRFLERDDAIMHCFDFIRSADAMYFLPDWKLSDGAALERRFAEYIGKPIVRDLDTMEVRRPDD